MTETVAAAITASIILLIVLLAIGLLILIGTVVLITWIVKKVWFWGRENKKPEYREYGNDWFSQAQRRQDARNEYTDPVRTPKWEYNEKTKMWVDAEQLEQERHRQANAEIREKWEKLKEEERQLQEEEEYIRSFAPKITLTPEEQELAKQIHVERNGPTYEEWKKMKEAENKKQPPRND